MLKLFSFLRTEHIESGKETAVVFEDAAPPHFTRNFRHFVNARMSDRLSGGSEPITWPP
jgi:hypothetical protein